jgi:glycosyltransferase involved in cell wall biosynthesis
VLTSDHPQKPLVSVIIPSYNTAQLITTCLDSVRNQTYRDFETIVVNDGSPDAVTLEQVLQPYMNEIIYISQANKGAAGARNAAIQKAKGQFLAFLDSDDSWLPEHLAAQINLLTARSNADLAYSDAWLISFGSQQTFMQKCPSEGVATFEALVVERCQIPISTVVVRKDTIVGAGLFDEKLRRCDDYDMWLRCAFLGARIVYSRKVQARLNVGRADSLGQSSAKMNEAYWKILQNAEGLPLTARQRSLVCNRAAEIRAAYLLEAGKSELWEQHPEKATELFVEANQQLRRMKLAILILMLKLAPQAACKLALAFRRLRS